MKKRTRRQKAIIRRRIFLSACAAVLVAVIALVAFICGAIFDTVKPNDSKNNNESTVSKEKIPESYATVLSIGDVMAHSTQITGAKTSSGYDFSAFFKETSPYFKEADLTIANLELTFGGTESGVYRGYPVFNTPDELANDIKNSGINMLMTANNHTYDTGSFGMKRTLDVIRGLNFESNGTRKSEQEPKFIVKEINNIKIGIINYTYETTKSDQSGKYLNGIKVKDADSPLINSFNYNTLDNFYAEARDMIKQMKNNGAEFITFYMHWGEEYQLSANTWQKSIAQKLSDMGVNMIIGGHPHVVQPMQLIHSQDGQNTTVCIYSLGNAVSNQRRELISNSRKGHTEDGVIFSYTLKKSSDGSVSLVDLDLIPTWVHRYSAGSGYHYTIYPIESLEEATAKYPSIASKLTESYNRTKATVEAGLTECQKHIGCETTFK